MSVPESFRKNLVIIRLELPLMRTDDLRALGEQLVELGERLRISEDFGPIVPQPRQLVIGGLSSVIGGERGLFPFIIESGEVRPRHEAIFQEINRRVDDDLSGR